MNGTGISQVFDYKRSHRKSISSEHSQGILDGLGDHDFKRVLTGTQFHQESYKSFVTAMLQTGRISQVSSSDPISSHILAVVI